MLSNLCRAALSGGVILLYCLSSDLAAALSPLACTVSISLLKLSTAPSTCTKKKLEH